MSVADIYYICIIHIYIDIYRVVMKVKKRFNLKPFNVSLLQLRSFVLFLSLSLHIYYVCMYVCIYIYIYIFILLINIVSDTEIKEKF